MFSTLARMNAAAYGIHFSDQVALVAVPLIAALAFDASPEVIGVLVACQAAAHLLGSIPFGILVDRCQQRNLAIAACLMSLFGFLGAVFAIQSDSVLLFGIFVTLAGFGVVLFSLAALSILPKIASKEGLASANASIEIPRAINSFAVPLAIGLVVTDFAPGLLFLAAAIGATVALASTWSLPRFSLSTPSKTRAIPQILEGGAYVVKHRLLLPISLCAVFWNIAFAALLVVLIPLISDVLLYDAGAFGIGLAAFGSGMIMGTALIGRVAQRIAPGIILLFGPGVSFLTVLAMALIPAGTSPVAFYGCFILLGFGPSMWLVTQNSVRQLVTPPATLGRVNAVIQTAIYGVRPLGALIGGVVVGSAGAQTGIAFVVVAFAVSFLVAALSGLRGIKSYVELSPAEAG